MCTHHEARPSTRSCIWSWSNPKYKYWVGGEWVESSPGEKDSGVFMDKKVNMTQLQRANHILSCIQSSVDSRSREVILPLCCSHQTPPRVLHSALGFNITRTWTCWNEYRPESLSWSLDWSICPAKTRLRVGAVQPGEEKASGRSNSTSQYLNKATRKLERDFSQGQVVIRWGWMALSWRRIGLG